MAVFESKIEIREVEFGSLYIHPILFVLALNLLELLDLSDLLDCWDSADWPCMLVETVLGHALATTGELICNMSRTDGWGGGAHPVR